MKKQLTWRQSIEKVLREAATAMHYKDITDRIIEKGLRTELGATPASTVASTLLGTIKNEGAKCPWKKIGKGLYVWQASKSSSPEPQAATSFEEEEVEEEQYAIVSSFGMFWSREAIDWIANPKILGMQQIGAEPVDFSRQIGIYLLYDGREVIYVGRATERPRGKRLYEHTADRLSARWNRFSWFGVLPVSDDGKLGDMPDTFTGNSVIPTLEALLIEALEPRQNRKRGDDLAAVEFIQKLDPEIQKKLIKTTMERALNNL